MCVCDPRTGFYMYDGAKVSIFARVEVVRVADDVGPFGWWYVAKLELWMVGHGKVATFVRAHMFLFPWNGKSCGLHIIGFNTSLYVCLTALVDLIYSCS